MSIVIRNKVLHLIISIFTVLCCFTENIKAEGHNIEGIVSGYEGKLAILAMMYGGNEYVIDTAEVYNGAFSFATGLPLQSGAYIVFLPPAGSFLILVNAADRQIQFQADFNNIAGTIQFDNSEDNSAYYAYLKFFDTKRSALDMIKSDYDVQAHEGDKIALLSNMQQLKNEVIKHQKKVIEAYPESMTAAMIRCELAVEIPAFTGSPEEINQKKYAYQRAHYFDQIDLADERLIRAPANVLIDRVDYYLDNLILQQPDTLISEIDDILEKTFRTDASYRFFLTHIFNKYRESKSIGMDAIYVHIAEKYIATGRAPWIDDEQKNAVLAAVKNISPTLIGKQAPDFTVQMKDGKDISLYGINSPFTVLFFWAPNCAHCKQSIPILKEFNDQYKEKGVQVFAVCTKLSGQEKNCWDYLEENNLDSWINASDQHHGQSSIHTKYNIQGTPKIYVLDADKTILAKDLGVEHLEEVMTRLQL